eukprot:gene9658-biopygen60
MKSLCGVFRRVSRGPSSGMAEAPKPKPEAQKPAAVKAKDLKRVSEGELQAVKKRIKADIPEKQRGAPLDHNCDRTS